MFNVVFGTRSIFSQAKWIAALASLFVATGCGAQPDGGDEPTLSDGESSESSSVPAIDTSVDVSCTSSAGCSGGSSGGSYSWYTVCYGSYCYACYGSPGSPGFCYRI
jgi:hypothetical protein